MLGTKYVGDNFDMLMNNFGFFTNILNIMYCEHKRQALTVTILEYQKLVFPARIVTVKLLKAPLTF